MNPDSWEYISSPSRVFFGAGSLNKIPQEFQRLKLSKPLLLSTPTGVSRAESLAQVLKDASITPAGAFSGAKMHTPVEVTEKALSYAKEVEADSVISIGGGSVIGLGKAISVYTGLYHICVPTTYAGSEMTPILGETKDGKKTTRSDPKILPGTVVYDVDLTMTMPVDLSKISGVNALAHAVEALYAKNSNPVTTMFATNAILSLKSLPDVVSNPNSQSARTKVFYGTYLASACLGTANMSLHHKLCHTLGGSFSLPHAEVHTIMLPHSVSYNAPAVGSALEPLKVLSDGTDNAVAALDKFVKSLGVEKRSLKELGMREEDVDKAAEIACQQQYPNPRPLEQAKIRELIRRAWAGEEARADL